jgi:hypothetical protein
MTAMTATWIKNPMMAVKQVTMLFSFLLTRPAASTALYSTCGVADVWAFMGKLKRRTALRYASIWFFFAKRDISDPPRWMVSYKGKVSAKKGDWIRSKT